MMWLWARQLGGLNVDQGKQEAKDRLGVIEYSNWKEEEKSLLTWARMYKRRTWWI
jgi:hypothetical protein